MACQHAIIPLGHVRDGASHTYLFGERFLRPDRYADGVWAANDQSLYIGYDRDVMRYTHASCPPLQDRNGVDYYFSFGSAHAGIFQMVFCDGAVRTINYSIDSATHKALGSRASKDVFDTGKM